MQIDLFVVDDLRTLMETQEQWCVSLFMPTHRVSTLVKEDRIRFKIVLREAQDKLASIGSDLSLDSASRLMDDRPFWHHQSEGLAVFCSRDLFRAYRLPISFEQLVVVAARFHLKPVLPLLTGDYRFYVLALSQNEVRLLQCNRFTANEVNLGDTPRSLDEALRFDEREKQLQLHTHGATGSGKQAAIFHGHGVGHDDAKDRILRFFQQLDKGLQTILHKERAPVVIAAVDYLVPLFKQATSYPYVLDQILSGNPDEIPGDELHAKALEIVGPRFDQKVLDQFERFAELSGTNLVSSDLEKIVRAAHHGRVDILFVPVGVRLWGTLDPASDEVTLLPEGEEGAYDLLDLAAARTLLNSGAVYAVTQENMPNNQPVAAIFRY